MRRGNDRQATAYVVALPFLDSLKVKLNLSLAPSTFERSKPPGPRMDWTMLHWKSLTPIAE
jgi:hypothetical protein